MSNLKHKTFTVYISPLKPSGGYRVDVWDDDFTMYPERFNTKFYGYTVTEIKNFIEAGLKDKYKPLYYALTLDFIIKND